MKWHSILVVALAVCASGELPPPEKSYKILMLLPISTQSHRNTFIALAEGLANRGHKVVMFTNNNKERIVTENIYEFYHGIEELNVDKYNMFELKGGLRSNVHRFKEVLAPCIDKIYSNSEVNELYRKKKMFDLIVVDALVNEIMYPFAHEMPFVTIATAGFEYRQSAELGNPLNPAYVPFMYSSMRHPMSLVQRIQNLVYHLGFAFYWDIWMPIPLMQQQLSSKFPNLPPLLDIERNQSLTLSNSHFSMGTAIPLLPSQVEVGGIHCRPAQPLPQDLEDWIEGSGRAGVIYFSLGSIARSTTMPERFRKIILEAFSRLHQRVIWKYEGDFPGVPENVLIRSWLPQQDILGHPKVKVFMTHGGLLSIQEAVYHATPLISMPLGIDQPKNTQTIVDQGIGLSLLWEELTSADQVVDALLEIFQNRKYQETVEEMSTSLKDQLQTPLDRAIYWTEYVIRHQGAPGLRSPAARLSWVEFLLLDVLGLLLLAIGLIFVVLRTIIRKCFRFLKSKIMGERDIFCLPLSRKEKTN